MWCGHAGPFCSINLIPQLQQAGKDKIIEGFGRKERKSFCIFYTDLVWREREREMFDEER